MIAAEAPFSSPELILFDSLRAYCIGAAALVIVALVVQFLAAQPGLRHELQVARRLFIAGAACLLAADVSTNVSRFGHEPMNAFRLFATTLGLTLLLVWVYFESRARRVAAGG